MISDIPGSTDLREFPYGIIEYEIDKTKLLGTGLWSDVYFAAPSLPKATSTTSPTEVPYNTESILTPPLTPVKHRNSLSRSSAAALPPIPCAYAIKVPTSRQAKAVFEAEARILSYLSSFPRAGDHIVPFFGLDTRNQAIIMGALPQTLETFVTTELASLSEEGRTEKLASIFPPLALYLIRGLEWLTEKGCVHADIKPGNILLSDTVRPIYADFSSAIFLYEQPTSQGPLGGGTWDFLCPSLLRSAASAAGRLTPSTKTDLYSLAIALLYVIIGGSPFDSAGSNAFRRREMAKSGNPLLWAFGGDEGWKSEKRIKELSKRVGWDVQQFLKMGLEKLEMRVEVGVWREELEGKTGGS
ncbi:hypothetical protein K432DRAFT_381341 [Lepidopterella palustris CBS 459.81]|uniref:Autophagy-related protein 1 n=1 Tax=Lepidopterella palustris CBS 459.81 TaxID=1314670 RepID=A0A8E2JG67_9PEZI|nr:hypothetical protein K432DRAFT_381341 [Lepidopterella palustris CBS 459.81]